MRIQIYCFLNYFTNNNTKTYFIKDRNSFNSLLLYILNTFLNLNLNNKYIISIEKHNLHMTSLC